MEPPRSGSSISSGSSRGACDLLGFFLRSRCSPRPPPPPASSCGCDVWLSGGRCFGRGQGRLMVGTHPWGGWGAPRVLLRLCPRLCGLAQRTIEATLRCCRIRLQSSLPHNHEGLRPTTSPKLFAQRSAGSGRQAHQNPLVLLHFLLQMLPIAAHMSMRVSEQGSGRMLGLKKNAEGLPGDAEPDHGADACCEEHQRSTSVVQLWRRWLLQGRGRGVCLDKCPGRRTVRARTASSVCFDDRISAHHVAEVR